MANGPSTWAPTRFRRFEESFRTSTRPCLVLTDAGRAFVKGLGNPQGPHVLASEWVGTRAASWLGLSTFETAHLVILDDDEIPLNGGGQMQPGTAIATRAVVGSVWGGSEGELNYVANKGDFAGLVVLDTWLRNCDRQPPAGVGRRPNFDNVFLARDEQGVRVLAVDHTHCFDCGRDLTTALASIDKIKDERLYGLFEAFRPFLTRQDAEMFSAKLREFSALDADECLRGLATDWQIDSGTKQALKEFLTGRASFVADRIVADLAPLCWSPQ